MSSYVLLAAALLGIALWVAFSPGRRGGPQLHTITETAATLLAAVTGVLALVRYQGRRTLTALFVGVGFLGAAFLDGYHAVVTSTYFTGRFPSPAASLTPWSWLASRFFLAVFLFSSWLALFRNGDTDEEPAISDRVVYWTGAGLTLASFVFFALVSLPPAQVEGVLHRPQELLPALFFGGALVGYLRRGGWRTSSLEHWLILSLMTGFFSQAGLMVFSDGLYSPYFEAAHLLKFASYAFLFTGLVIDTLAVFRHERVQRGELERSRRELADRGQLLEETVAERTKELRHSEGRFRRIAESGMLGIIFWDLDGRITEANDAFLEMVGYTRAELEADRINWAEMTPPEYRQADQRAIAELADRGVCTPFEKEYLRKDGSRVPIQVGIATFEEGSAGVAYVLDITDRKTAERQLRRLNEELEARVADRTAELEQANEELQAFAYTVSHDLRAPLRQVDGFSRILVDEYADELSEEASHYLGMARESAVRMGRLVDELLEFSRLGQREVAARRVSPTEVAKKALEDLDDVAEQTDAEITVADMPPCSADPDLLRLVYLNLLDNALKFAAGREDPRIEVGCEEVDGEPAYFVRDNGVGFDMRYADKLFGVFQRLHRSEDFPGTGVGLATVQRIVHRHRGRVWADSETGRGATFHFTMPGVNRR